MVIGVAVFCHLRMYVGNVMDIVIIECFATLIIILPKTQMRKN